MLHIYFERFKLWLYFRWVLARMRFHSRALRISVQVTLDHGSVRQLQDAGRQLAEMGRTHDLPSWIEVGETMESRAEDIVITRVKQGRITLQKP